MTEQSPAVNTSAASDFAAPHLLVVDDDKRLRTLLQDFLQENGYLVSTATDAADAREKLTLLTVELIVLDVMMKGETGLQFLEALRKKGDTTPVLMLTARGESEDRIKGLEVGADDYLAKPFEPRELLLRIGAVLRRQPKPSTPSDIRLGRWRFDPTREELIDGETVVRLSSVEAGLLRALAQQPGSIVSREELVARQPLASNERTIDVQVTRLRRKIETDPKNPRYLMTVRGEGYVLRPDP
jgi:two-component system, OmpR family, phosphate regulon response regulator OmpR